MMRKDEFFEKVLEMKKRYGIRVARDYVRKNYHLMGIRRKSRVVEFTIDEKNKLREVRRIKDDIRQEYNGYGLRVISIEIQGNCAKVTLRDELYY